MSAAERTNLKAKLVKMRNILQNRVDVNSPDAQELKKSLRAQLFEIQL